MALPNKDPSDVFSMAPTQGLENYGGSQVDPATNGGIYGNSTNGTIPPPFEISKNYTLPWMVAVAVLLFLLVIITVFGNLLVIVALFRYRNLRSISNYLIGNLAVSDFLLACTILPMSTVNELLGYWVFGDILCRFWLVADVLYCTASIWNLCVIAFDRFTATLYPLWYREKRTVKQAIAYIIIVWVLSFAISVPPLLGWTDFTKTYVDDDKMDIHLCVLFNTQGYVAYSASGSFFIPFFITVFLYIRIFGVLRHRIRKMRANEKIKNKAKKQAKAIDKSHSGVNANNTTSSTNKEKAGTTQIELSAVNKSDPSSVQPEEHSNKSLFGSDSQGDNKSEEDEDSAPARSDHPLYVSSSEAEGTGQVAKNGIKSKGNVTAKDNKNNETSTGLSDPLVINNTTHNSMVNGTDKETDTDNIQIVVTEDNTSVLVPKNTGGNGTEGSLQIKFKNKLLSASKEVLTRKDSDKSFTQRKLANPLRNPFKKDREKPRSSQKQRRFDQREVRATIRMAIIIAFFCGCWVGFFIIYVVRSFCGDRCHIPSTLEAFLFWLGYSNSAMNPILYTIFNDDFRKAFQKLLGCHKVNAPGQGKAKVKH